MKTKKHMFEFYNTFSDCSLLRCETHNEDVLLLDDQPSLKELKRAIKEHKRDHKNDIEG